MRHDWLAYLLAFSLGLGLMSIVQAFGQSADAPNLTIMQAEVCSPDRPHRVTVEALTMICTAVACVGPLVCDAQNRCHRLPGGDSCNRCTMGEPSVWCLSDEELERARR